MIVETTRPSRLLPEALLDSSADLSAVINSVNLLIRFVQEISVTTEAISPIPNTDSQLALVKSQVAQLQVDFSALFDAVKKGKFVQQKEKVA